MQYPKRLLASVTALLALSGCANDYSVGQIDKQSQAGEDTAEPFSEAFAETEEEEPVTESPWEEAVEEGAEELEEEVEQEQEEEEEPEIETDPPPEDDCTDTSDLIYVIDRDDEELFLFDPESYALDSLGVLDCDMWVSPASMGVARDGFAYVRYSDQSLYRVDLENFQCELTSYEDSHDFGSFGMGYSTNSAYTWQDQLYVANAHSVAKLSTQDWTVSQLGSIPSQAELTGNAEGELWAFLPLESPAELVQLDKGSGAVIETVQLPGFPEPATIDTFAFATWGGEYFLFVRTFGMGSSTDVYRVTENGEMSMAVQGLGINVVGAGVSTCAPTE